MNNYVKIYWLTRLDYIQGIFLTAAIISGIIFLIYHVVKLCETYDIEEYKKNWGIYNKVSIYVCIVATMITAFTPSKQDMIMIYAGGKTMDYVQSDSSLSRIPQQTTTIISNYLDSKIEELKDKK